jgi:hypothetical protein
MMPAIAAPTVGESIVITVVSLFAIALLIRLLAWASNVRGVPRISPTLVSIVSGLYLILLLVSIVLYNNNVLDVQERLPPTVANALPLAVPWFGAVGGVVLSLQGVFDHNKDWDNSYGLWHLFRPLFGATLAIVAYFIFITFVRTTGAEPITPGEAPASDTNPFTYYILAFLVGYREETFRNLVKKASDTIFGPGDTEAPAGGGPTPPAGPSVDLIPAIVDHGSVTGGSVSVADVEFRNRSGASITVTVVTTNNQPEWSLVGADVAGKTWWVPNAQPQEVADGESLWIRTRWQPASDAGVGPPPRQATLTVEYVGFPGSPKTAVLTGVVSLA